MPYRHGEVAAVARTALGVKTAGSFDDLAIGERFIKCSDHEGRVEPDSALHSWSECYTKISPSRYRDLDGNEYIVERFYQNTNNWYDSLPDHVLRELRRQDEFHTKEAQEKDISIIASVDR